MQLPRPAVRGHLSGVKGGSVLLLNCAPHCCVYKYCASRAQGPVQSQQYFLTARWLSPSPDTEVTFTLSVGTVARDMSQRCVL